MTPIMAPLTVPRLTPNIKTLSYSFNYPLSSLHATRHHRCTKIIDSADHSMSFLASQTPIKPAPSEPLVFRFFSLTPRALLPSLALCPFFVLGPSFILSRYVLPVLDHHSFSSAAFSLVFLVLEIDCCSSFFIARSPFPLALFCCPFFVVASFSSLSNLAHFQVSPVFGSCLA